MQYLSRKLLLDFILFATAVSLTVASCGSVSARDDENSSSVTTSSESTSSPTATATAKTETKSTSSSKTKAAIETKSSSTPATNIKERLEAKTQTAVRLNASEVADKIKSAKEERDAKLQSAHEKFEAKVAEIKDARKQQLARNLAQTLNRINDNHTKNYLARLDRLDNIIDKIEERSKAAQTQGKEVTTILASLAASQAQIDTLRTKIIDQQAKVYTVELQSGDTARTDFQKTHAQLKSDLAGLKAEILTVKKSIESSVFKQLKSLSQAESATSPTTSTSPSADL